MRSQAAEVEALLQKWRDGNRSALDELVPKVYAELRRLARRALRSEGPWHTLQPTALTHELFLELSRQRKVGWQNRAHFFAVASYLMRRILAEHARKRAAAKRDGGIRVSLDEGLRPMREADPRLAANLLDLHDALSTLERLDPRQARIVELRYFGGLTIEEAAELLDVSPATVKRDWTVARLWLRRELGGR